MTLRVWSLLGLLYAMKVSDAAAHTGQPVAPHDLWSAWATDPWPLLLIGVAALLYARGTAAVWGRAGRGRGIEHWRFWCYCGGILALLIALVSPLNALGGALFSGHMAQHEVMIVIAAPLLVLGKPQTAFLWALPRGARKRIGRLATRPPVRSVWRLLSSAGAAWTLHAAAIWVWHLPQLYQATLRNEGAHTFQHLSFFLTALLFWWVLLHPSPHRRLSAGIGVLYLFTTAAYGSALGALLTFAPEPWYPAYRDGADSWGFSLLEDQQLGGLIMWIPFGALYTGAALALFLVWFRAIGPAPAPAGGARAS